MEPQILSYYKKLKVELEVAKLNLELLKDKESYITNLLSKDKKENIKNDIKVTILYINKLKSNLKNLGELIVNLIYIKATNKEKIVFRDYIILEKSAKSIMEEHPDITLNFIYNTAKNINKALSKIKIEDNNIWNIIADKATTKK